MSLYVDKCLQTVVGSFNGMLIMGTRNAVRWLQTHMSSVQNVNTQVLVTQMQLTLQYIW